MEKITLTEAQYMELAKYANKVIDNTAVQISTSESAEAFVRTIRARIVDYCRDNYGFWMLEDQLQNVLKLSAKLRLG